MSVEERLPIANRLREMRIYLGYTQQEVAEAIKIPRPSLTLIESGHRNLTVTELVKLASLYRQPVSYFLGERQKVVMELPAGLDASDKQELRSFAEFLAGRRTALTGSEADVQSGEGDPDATP